MGQINETWTDEGLEAAQGFLQTSKELLTALENSPEDSGVDLVELRSALQELEEEIGKVQN